jgi:hypothetical protein
MENEDKNEVVAAIRAKVAGLTELVDKLDATDPKDLKACGLLFCDLADAVLTLEILLTGIVAIVGAFAEAAADAFA